MFCLNPKSLGIKGNASGVGISKCLFPIQTRPSFILRGKHPNSLACISMSRWGVGRGTAAPLLPASVRSSEGAGAWVGACESTWDWLEENHYVDEIRFSCKKENNGNILCNLFICPFIHSSNIVWTWSVCRTSKFGQDTGFLQTKHFQFGEKRRRWHGWETVGNRGGRVMNGRTGRRGGRCGSRRAGQGQNALTFI